LDLLDRIDRIHSMSFEELMAEANRLIARVKALDNKERSKRLACQTRSKSIPKNATIRKEFVKCNKPDCYHKKHGPYYYAYWKDHETKKLKQKYIGRYYYPAHEQENVKANGT
jgi:hypothetical protein